MKENIKFTLEINIESNLGKNQRPNNMKIELLGYFLLEYFVIVFK
jgi:hypothetical protein